MVREILVRFVVGGLVVSIFSSLSDILKPKSFAGLFGAAPSIALATMGLTIATEGTAYVALEARSMVAGAIAMFVYACLMMLIMAKFKPPTILASTTLLAAWLATSIGIWFFILR